MFSAHAAHEAARTDHPVAMAEAHNVLGILDRDQDPERARWHHETSLTLVEDADQGVRAAARNNLRPLVAFGVRPPTEDLPIRSGRPAAWQATSSILMTFVGDRWATVPTEVRGRGRAEASPPSVAGVRPPRTSLHARVETPDRAIRRSSHAPFGACRLRGDVVGTDTRVSVAFRHAFGVVVRHAIGGESDLDVSHSEAADDCVALGEFGLTWEQLLDVVDATGDVVDTAFPRRSRQPSPSATHPTVRGRQQTADGQDGVIPVPTRIDTGAGGTAT